MIESAGLRSNDSSLASQKLSNRIRIASFKLAGAAQQQNPSRAIGVIADICRRFDLVAFQEVDGHRPGWLDELTTEMARQSNGQAVFQLAHSKHSGEQFKMVLSQQKELLSGGID